jgi:NADPH2:quinone reductase
MPIPDAAADRARIATIVVSARARELGIKLLGNGPSADPGTEIRNNARLELVTLAGQGRLQMVTRSVPLAQAAKRTARSTPATPAARSCLVP